MKGWMSLKKDCVGSKTRSLGQILEKPCVHSKGHIFSPTIMKLGQNVCLDEIPMFVSMKSQISLEMGQVGSKTRSLGHM